VSAPLSLEALTALVHETISAQSRAAVDAARAEGFTLGTQEGWLRAVREMRVRLNQLGVDMAAAACGGDLVLGNADGAGSLGSLDRMQAAVSHAEPEAAPAVGSRLPAAVPASAGVAAPSAAPARDDAAPAAGVLLCQRRGGRPAEAQVWRTPARAEVLRREWPLGTPAAAIRPMLAALPGAKLPYGVDISIWASQLGRQRPEGFRGRRTIRAAPAEAEAAAPADDVAAITAPAPAGPAAAAVIQVAAHPQPPAPVAAPVEADFRVIRAWCEARGMRFDGANIDAINRVRMAGFPPLPPFVQVGA